MRPAFCETWQIAGGDEVENGPPTILLTGGTGTFGQAYVRRRLAGKNGELIRIFSRDEMKQYEMAQAFGDDPRLRFFIGDVRDKERLRRAMDGVDLVVHAAAMKHVPICEFNPAEAVKTNVDGAQNVVDCSIDAAVSRVVALSTDKAVNPVNLYGATKLCAEKIFVHGNVYAGARATSFACVRYGNVMASRGSVIPLFRKQAQKGVLTITDRRMTRFWLSVQQAVDFVDFAASRVRGGEIFIPKIPSMRVIDLAKAIGRQARIEEVGIRPGEKLHEILMTAEESARASDGGSYLVVHAKPERVGRNRVADGFIYTSDTNQEWLSVKKIRELIGEVERKPWVRREPLTYAPAAVPA